MVSIVKSDLDKKVTYGDADGPDTFVDQLGIVVPTFIDPRTDLIPGRAKSCKRVKHHIPFKMRGFFTATDWPEKYRVTISWRQDDDGFVLCDGTTRNGNPCSSKAVNRTRYCRNHGGGLHPLDKKISIKNVVEVPKDRIAQLTRVQRFLQGFISVEELSDEEIQGMFLYEDDGTKIQSISLGIKIHQQIAQELHKRLNRFLQTKTASMLAVMVDIAESELVEPADRIKAAQWVAERTLGKTPDIIIHGKNDAPYESIFQTIDAGSREDYRKKISSTRLELGGEHDPILDVEIVGQPEHRNQRNERAERDENHHSGQSSTSSNLESAQRCGENNDELNRQKELKKARAKAKQRRYAARAVGATTTHDLPWLVEWKFLSNGTFRMKLVCPDDQTPAKLDKVNKSNAEALEKAEAYRRNNVA